MIIKIPIVSEERASHIQNYQFSFITIKSVTKRDSSDIYDIQIEYPDEYGAEMLASDFFGCGVLHGLNLQYSHYGTEPERVR